MPKTVEVPGKGLVEFPDSMSNEQIEEAISTEFYVAPAVQQATGMAGAIGGAISTLLPIGLESQRQMQEEAALNAIEEPQKPETFKSQEDVSRASIPKTGEASTTYGGPKKAVASYGETMSDVQAGVETPLARIVAPRVSPSEARVDFPEIPIDSKENWIKAAGKAAANLAIALPEFFTSDMGIAAILGGKLAPSVTALGFSADLTKAAAQEAAVTYENWDKMSPADRAVAVVNLVGTTLFAAGTGKHAFSKSADFMVPSRELAAEINKTVGKMENFQPQPKPLYGLEMQLSENPIPPQPEGSFELKTQGLMWSAITKTAETKAPMTASAVAKQLAPEVTPEPAAKPTVPVITPKQDEQKPIEPTVEPVAESATEVPAATEKVPSEIPVQATAEAGAKPEVVQPEAPKGPPQYPKIPKKEDGDTQEMLTQKWNTYRDSLNQYKTDLSTWEQSLPANEPIIFKTKNDQFITITPDPKGGYRATTFTQLWNDDTGYSPWGHIEYKTRLDALAETVRRGKLTKEFPEKIYSEDEIKAITERKQAEYEAKAREEAAKANQKPEVEAEPEQPSPTAAEQPAVESVQAGSGPKENTGAATAAVQAEPKPDGNVGVQPVASEKIIKDLYGKRTAASKSIQAAISDGFSYVENLSPEAGLAEMQKSKTFWNSEIERLKKVAEGKSEPTQKDISDQQYWESKSGKQIPIDDWAKSYGIPYAQSSLKKAESTEGAINRLLSLSSKRNRVREVADESKPDTGESKTADPTALTGQYLVAVRMADGTVHVSEFPSDIAASDYVAKVKSNSEKEVKGIGTVKAKKKDTRQSIIEGAEKQYGKGNVKFSEPWKYQEGIEKKTEPAKPEAKVEPFPISGVNFGSGVSTKEAARLVEQAKTIRAEYQREGIERLDSLSKSDLRKMPIEELDLLYAKVTDGPGNLQVNFRWDKDTFIEKLLEKKKEKAATEPAKEEAKPAEVPKVLAKKLSEKEKQKGGEPNAEESQKGQKEVLLEQPKPEQPEAAEVAPVSSEPAKPELSIPEGTSEKATGLVSEITTDTVSGSYSPKQTLRYQQLGAEVVPGIRLGDAEEAGRLFVSYAKGETSKADWDKWVSDAKASGRVYENPKQAPPLPKFAEGDKVMVIDPATGMDIREGVVTASGPNGKNFVKTNMGEDAYAPESLRPLDRELVPETPKREPVSPEQKAYDDAIKVYGDENTAFKKLSDQLSNASELKLSDEQVAGIKETLKRLNDKILERDGIMSPEKIEQAFLKVEVPDIGEAQEAAKFARRQIEAIREKRKELEKQLADIKKVVTTTRGSYGRKFERIKASAKGKDVAEYRRLQDEVNKTYTEENAIERGSQKDQQAMDNYIALKSVADTSAPLLRRMSKRMWLYQGKAPAELVRAYNAMLDAEIRKRYPDAAPVEVEGMREILDRDIKAGTKPEDVFKYNSQLQNYIPTVRALRLQKAIENAKAKGNVELWPDEFEKLVNEYLPKPSYSREVSKPIESIQQLESLIAEAEKVSELAAAKAKAIAEEQVRAEAEAKALEMAAIAEAQAIVDSAPKIRDVKKWKQEFLGRLESEMDKLIAEQKITIEKKDNGEFSAYDPESSNPVVGKIEAQANGTFKLEAHQLRDKEKEIKATLDTIEEAERLAKALAADGSGKVVLAIPGNGIYKLNKSGGNLVHMWDAGRKLSASKTSEKSVLEKKVSDKNPPKIPKRKPEDASAHSQVQSELTGDEEMGFDKAHSDGTRVVATDGASVVEIRGSFQKIPNDKINLVAVEAIFPSQSELLKPAIKADTELLWKAASAAETLPFADELVRIQLFERDGKVVGGMGVNERGESVGYGDFSGAKSIGTFQSKYIKSIAGVARKLGNEQLDLRQLDRQGTPMSFDGKNIRAAVVPISEIERVSPVEYKLELPTTKQELESLITAEKTKSQDLLGKIAEAIRSNAMGKKEDRIDVEPLQDALQESKYKLAMAENKLNQLYKPAGENGGVIAEIPPNTPKEAEAIMKAPMTPQSLEADIKGLANAVEVAKEDQKSLLKNGKLPSKAASKKWDELEEKIKSLKASIEVLKGQKARLSMGNASVEEFAERPRILVATKNAAIDAFRREMGLPPMMEPLRKSNPELWAQAMTIIDNDNNAADALITRFKDVPFIPTDVELVILTQRRADLRVTYERARRQLAQSKRDGTASLDAGFETTMQYVMDQLIELDGIVGRGDASAGTMAGRALNARKITLNEMFMLDSMISDLMADGDGKPLTPEKRKEVEAISEEARRIIEEQQRQVVEKEQQLLETQAQLQLARLERDTMRENYNRYMPAIVQRANELAERARARADEAKAKFKRLMGWDDTPTVPPETPAYSGIPLNPEMIDAIVTFATSKIQEYTARAASRGILATMDAASFMREMVSEFGERVRDIVTENRVYESALDRATREWSNRESEVNPGRPEETPRQPRQPRAPRQPGEQQPAEPRTPRRPRNQGERLEDELDDIIEKNRIRIGDRYANDDIRGIAGDAQRIAKAYVMKGVRGWRNIADAVHNEIRTVIEDWDYRDTLSAITKYGKFKELSKTEADIAFRDAKGEMRTVRQIQDLFNYGDVLPTGPEFPKASDIQRRYEKVREEFKKRFGVADPEVGLRSALQSRKTYFRNRIADLNWEIENRRRIVRNKTSPPTDPELQSLMAELENLKQQESIVFADQIEASQMQKAIELARQNQQIWEQRLAQARNGIYNWDTGRKDRPTSFQLDYIRGQAEAIKAEIERIKSLDAAYQEKVQGDRLVNSIAEYTLKLQTYNLWPEAKPEKATTPALEALREERAELVRQLREARRNSPEAVQAAIQAAKEFGDKLAQKINEGDVDPTPKMSEAKRINPELQAIREENASLQKVIAELRRAKRTEAELVKVAKENLEKKIAYYEKRVANKDIYDKEKPAPPKPDKEMIELNYRLHEIHKKWMKMRWAEREAKKAKLDKALTLAAESLRFARAMITGGEFSAVLRQGGFINFGHPVMGAKAMIPMFKAFASGAHQLEVHREILTRDNAPLYHKYGLELTEMGGKLTQMEETYMYAFADNILGLTNKIPMIGKYVTKTAEGTIKFTDMFARAYTTYLNRLRADAFDAMAETYGRDPVTLEQITNYINVATGRGSKTLKRMGPGLNTFGFAPMYTFSRLQLLTLQPLWRGNLATRKMIAKEYLRTAAGLGFVMALGYMAGARIGIDPRSTDFLKLRFGNLRVDPFFGVQQWATYLARQFTGWRVNQKGRLRPLRKDNKILPQGSALDKPKYGEPTAFDVTAKFARGKAAPWLSNLMTLAEGENIVGDEATMTRFLADNMIPITWRDMMDVYQNDGLAASAAMVIPAFLGIGVSSYKTDRVQERR